MRLTLRTLLAWLDDTLPAAEVRQIGKQVAESPFAQELVDKTYRVTRQRRLLVPPSSGPEGTDPNLVAAYLDNELAPAEIADYEKKCLTSDVNLAEVASVHQILSLIGQKAKVPAEAKYRMYRLIKGRESAGTRTARASRPAEPGPVTPPISPWSAPPTVARPIAERIGIGALVVGLLLVVGWTAYSTFLGDPALLPESRVADSEAKQPPPTPPESRGMASTDATADRPSAVPKSNAPGGVLADARKPGDGGSPATALPAIKLVKADQVALGWNAEKSDWTRLKESSPIKDGARILALAPFSPTFEVGPGQVSLVGDTGASISAADGKASVRLVLEHGRVILRGGAEARPYQVDGTGPPLTIESKAGTTIGLERTWKLLPGEAAVPVAPLKLFLGEGEATFRVGETKLVLHAPRLLNYEKSGLLTTLPEAPVPAWVGGEGAAPSGKQLGERFLGSFSPNGSVLRDLVQAVDGDDPEIRRLAITALAAVGDAEMVVPVLNNAMFDPGSRRVAADVLLSMLARGGEAAKAVRAELVKVFGGDWADDTEKLLIGFTAEQKKREQTYTELVKLLEAPELGTRELAIRALTQLTGRDALEYDVLKPAGKGLRAWQDLLHKKELLKAQPAPAPSP